MHPMPRLTLVFCFAIALGSVRAAAQTPMTLQEVVDRAVTRSLLVDNAELQLAQSRVDLRQNELSRYPSLSAQGSGGYQFGLNIDPTTNTLQQQALGFMSYSLDAGVNLYQGGRIRRSIAQSRANIAASEATVESRRQDVALQAAQFYLEVLLAGEEAAAADTRLAQARAQLDRTTRLIAGGQLAPVDSFELAAQLARQAQGAQAARNAEALARLRLGQLLRLTAGETLALAPAGSLDLDAVQLPDVTTAELYSSAVARQPAVRAAQLNVAAAELGIAVARSGYLPTVSAFGQLNTRYSSQAVEFQSDNTIAVNTEKVLINGSEVEIGFPRPGGALVEKPIGDQFRDFFGQALGLSVRVPIFSNGQNRAAVDRAQLAVDLARLQETQAEQDVEIAVGQALQAARNARAEVEAARRALRAAQAAADAAERRSTLGAGSSFELTNAQILLEQAQVTLLRARYQYVFNAKVVDFYLGRPLAL